MRDADFAFPTTPITVHGLSATRDPPAERARCGPVAFRHRAVDDGDAGRAHAVDGLELTPGEHGDAEGPKVPGPDRGDVDHRPLPARGRVTLDLDGFLVARSREREAARPGGGTHGRILGEPARQLRREGQGARRVVSRQARVHVGHSHAPRLETEIDRERSNQASAQQPRGREQGETECDLRRDQSLVQTRAARDPARPGRQDRSGRRVRRSPGRQQSEQDAHEPGENGGEDEGPGTELRTEETEGEVLDERHLDEERQERARHDQSRRAAGEAEQQAFRQDLPGDASPARAERLADGDFLLTRRASGQQKVREIRARDQQGGEDGAREQSEDARRAELLVRAGRGHGRRDDGPSRGVEVLAVRGGVAAQDRQKRGPGFFQTARRAPGARRPTSSPSCGSGCRSSRADPWPVAARCRPAPRDPERWRKPRRENPSARRPRSSAGRR